MKIHFNSEGGFAGLKRQFDGDSDSLPANINSIVTKLVTEKEIYQNLLTNTKARDVMRYKLQIEGEEGLFSFSFDDLNTPAEILPLIKYAFKNAKPL